MKVLPALYLKAHVIIINFKMYLWWRVQKTGHDGGCDGGNGGASEDKRSGENLKEDHMKGVHISF